jgi:hypothetical protein
MATAPQIQALLRFLSQDAKIPLAISMGKIKELQKANLNRYYLPVEAIPSALFGYSIR